MSELCVECNVGSDCGGNSWICSDGCCFHRQDPSELNINEEVKELIAEAEQQLNTAINSDNDNEEWRLAKNMRNRTTKIIEKSKKIYY